MWFKCYGWGVSSHKGRLIRKVEDRCVSSLDLSFLTYKTRVRLDATSLTVISQPKTQ